MRIRHRLATLSNEWLDLPACPACRTAERTIVCEWNTRALDKGELRIVKDDR